MAGWKEGFRDDKCACQADDVGCYERSTNDPTPAPNRSRGAATLEDVERAVVERLEEFLDRG